MSHAETHPVAAPQLLGSLIGGRYRLEAMLGEGGQGTVFSATDTQLGRPVALKLLTLGASADGQQLERFRHEAELAKGLRHPNTVAVLDFGQDASQRPFIVYERLVGRGLDEQLTAGPISPSRVAAITSGVLKSLMEAHAAGIVHRDIKPANIFLCDFHGEREFVKVLDFGIATTAHAAAITQVGHAVGTPQYMAPEQVHGQAVSPATDLYALGITMAEMLCGHAVVLGRSAAEIAARQISSEPVPLPPAVLQSSLGAIVHRATRKDPAHRFRSAEQMLEAITTTPVAPSEAHAPHAQFASAPTDVAGVTPALVPAAIQPADKRRSSGGVIAWLVAAVVLVGLVGGGIYWFALSESDNGKTAKKKKPTKANTAKAKKATKDEPLVADVGWFNLEVAIANVDGDAIEDVVGMCDLGGGNVAVCAISGASMKTLWTTDEEAVLPGEVEKVYVTGKHAVVVTSRSVVKAFALESGELIRKTQTFLDGKHVCQPSEHPGHVWIADFLAEKPKLVNVVDGTMVDRERPQSCPRGHTRTDDCQGGRRDAWCPGIPIPNKVAGLDADRVYFTKREGIILGHRNDGPGYDMIAGYQVISEERGKVRWSRPFNDGDPAAAESRFGQSYAREKNASVAAGRIVAVSVSSAAAFDVSTGKTLWRRPRGETRGVLARDTRVYLLSSRGVRICDAATGKDIALIGSP